MLVVCYTDAVVGSIGMSYEALFDQFSTEQISAMIGLGIGLIFGIFAQQSRFCLRAACVEFWRGQTGSKFAIWLLAFGAAVLGTQYFIEIGAIDTQQIRQLNNVGSMSGAIIGGLIFGVGMVLAGGCASRLVATPRWSYVGHCLFIVGIVVRQTPCG